MCRTREVTWRVFCVVMSPTSVLQPRMGRMGSRSTPTIRLLTGIVLAATCSHPPAPPNQPVQTSTCRRGLRCSMTVTLPCIVVAIQHNRTSDLGTHCKLKMAMLQAHAAAQQQ